MTSEVNKYDHDADGTIDSKEIIEFTYKYRLGKPEATQKIR